MTIHLPIAPVGYLRRTHQGRFSPAAKAYHQYLEQVRLLWLVQAPGLVLPDLVGEIRFLLAMPPSWSKKQQAAMALQPHQGRLDVDNMLKMLFDALRPGDDARIWRCGPVEKRWDHIGGSGSITITICP
jgi:Holliday junction resolvase RusA-like endonuclease